MHMKELQAIFSSDCKNKRQDYNVAIDGKNFFNQPVKNDLITYENIGKIASGQGDDYKTGCLLDYNNFKNYDKIIPIDLSKQQVLNADPKAIQQNNFTGDLDRAGKTGMFFNIEEAKENILDFSQGTVKVLSMSSYNLATACSTILFCFDIVLVLNGSKKHFKRKIV